MRKKLPAYSDAVITHCKGKIETVTLAFVLHSRIPDMTAVRRIFYRISKQIKKNLFIFTHENFKEQMKEIGVHVEKIYFSGFCSQGDGACFNGRVTDWSKFLEAVGKPDLLEHATEHDLRLSWASEGRYSHSRSVSFDASGLWIENPYDEDD